jgi:DHA3 family macrolide efflux protein-like MFS transporter
MSPELVGSMGEEGRWARRFFTVWVGQAFSLIGSALVQFALMLWLAVTTGSPVVLAVAAVMGVLPQVFLGPFAGAYVDRFDRKRVMIAADGLTALATLLLMISFALGTVDLLQVFVILFFRSAMQGFHWPAMQASTTLMVPEEHLGRISGLNQTIQGISTILAPALGALLFVALPMFLVLSVDLVTAALAIISLLAVRIPEIRKAASKATVSVVADLKDAFRYLRSWRGILVVVAIFSVVNFLITPAFTLFSLLTLDYFGQGAYEVALIESISGVGMISGGVLLGVWGGSRRKIVTCMSALTLSGVGVLIIGLLPPDAFVLAVVASLIIGLTIAVINGTSMAIMQKGVRADMQGRVFALLGSISAGMSPLGLVLAAPIAQIFGIQAWFLLGGLTMIVIGAVSFFLPLVMRMEDRETEQVPLEPLPPA